MLKGVQLVRFAVLASINVLGSYGGDWPIWKAALLSCGPFSFSPCPATIGAVRERS